MQHAIVAAPHRHNLGDPVLAGGDHRGDGAVLRAESRARAGVDAHARIPGSLVGHQRRGHIHEYTGINDTAMQDALRQADQLVVRWGGHDRKLPTALRPGDATAATAYVTLPSTHLRQGTVTTLQA
jgi:hypothetical protein